MPLELSEQSFGRSVDTCSVDLMVTVLLENIDNGCDVFDSMDASSFGTWLCFSVLIHGIYPSRVASTFFTQSHGTEDDFEVGLCL